MENNSVSIIIPTYNRERTIVRAIESVIHQVDEKDEIIIVDDGSTDNTKEILIRYKNRIKYFYISNKGAGGARNKGLKEAKNTLITFLDSDDEWMPDKLEVQKIFMDENKDISFCFTNFGFRTKNGIEKRFVLNTWHNDTRKWNKILENETSLGTIKGIDKKYANSKFFYGNIYLPAFIYGNYLNVNTLMVRKKDINKNIHFGEDLVIYEEYELLGRLAKNHNCAYLDIETVWQNAHNDHRITDADGYERNESQLRVIERVWGKDKEFISENKKTYHKVVNEKRKNQIGYYIYSGEIEKAKKEIDKLKYFPLKYRIFAMLPVNLVKLYYINMRNIRRMFKKLFKHS